MKYRYDKLLGKIVEKYGTRGEFARKMGISQRSLSLKLNNIRHFTQDEIQRATLILDISPEEVGAYFFTYDVQNM